MCAGIRGCPGLSGRRVEVDVVVIGGTEIAAAELRRRDHNAYIRSVSRVLVVGCGLGDMLVWLGFCLVGLGCGSTRTPSCSCLRRMATSIR